MSIKTIALVSIAMVGLFLLPLANSNEQTRHSYREHTQANATNLGLYIGGHLGKASTSIDKNNLSDFYQQSGLTASDIFIDDGDTSFTLFIGYQFTQHISLETSHLNLGKRSVSFKGKDTDIESYYDNAEHIYPISADGYSIAIIGTLPLTKSFQVSIKLGYFSWQGNYQTQIQGNDSIVGSDSISGKDIWYSTEFNYRVNDSLKVYLGTQKYKFERGKVIEVGLGIRYFFSET